MSSTAERGLAYGDEARLKSTWNQVVIPVEISDEVMPGSNVDRVTIPELRDQLTGNAAVNGVPVDVAPV